MLVIYENHKIAGIRFGFKLDLNPITNEYEPHIFIRHLIEPKQAVAAFLNISHKSWNQTHKRWEAYSKLDDLNIYYMELSINTIFIISAFKI